MKVEIVNMAELDEAFRNLGKALTGQALVEAVEAGLEPILEDAKRRVPVVEGRLQRSLKTQIWEEAELAVEGEVYSDPDVAFHGHMVEYGTSHSDAHPFMRPAFDGQKGEAEERVRKVLAEKVNRVVG